MEIFPKGKAAHDTPGPYSVLVIFSDGSELMVCRNVADSVALAKMAEHTTGIGARVGTTKQVHIVDETGRKYSSWVYAPKSSLTIMSFELQNTGERK